ncbi:DUF7388 family protein [Halococcus thailandensis]|uniref:Luciferase n=1 Tax=Halococcus thailandensis JCM 13552 TaxID=1227457 RepID=M0N1Q4_9EURY|nr:hypothetical protein [Halococcus thailandensis]EMA51806.1 hypothetical protein C451_13671 [Halococcus thailandensis JCM 13552]
MSDLGAFASGFDAVALKPTEIDVASVDLTDVEHAVVDYEGREHLPEPALLADRARETALSVTTPVRADGFDPLGDDGLSATLPEPIGRVLVAGNPAYLTETERTRAIAPRIGAARERAPAAWVGTEGIGRVALAAGGTQFELLAPTTVREVRALRAAGFDDGIAVYTPVVRSADEDVLLDALGDYVARRGSVAAALDDARENVATAADGIRTDSGATGEPRSVLLSAIERFALVGTDDAIDERVAELRSAGVDTLVGYPARGPAALGR